MFKPGDKVRAKDKKLAEYYWENHPEIMEVLHVSFKCGEYISIVGSPNNGKSAHDNTKNWVYNADMFELCESVDSVPSETIEHEGYTYTRGEKIPESWVKKGVWAIDDDGDLARVYNMDNEGAAWETRERECNSSSVEYFTSQYRQFEETDWKWGMYCEFQGEVWLIFLAPLIFEEGICVHISKDDRALYVKASEIIPTFKR